MSVHSDHDQARRRRRPRGIDISTQEARARARRRTSQVNTARRKSTISISPRRPETSTPPHSRHETPLARRNSNHTLTSSLKNAQGRRHLHPIFRLSRAKFLCYGDSPPQTSHAASFPPRPDQTTPDQTRPNPNQPYPSVGNGCRATAPPERTLAAACVLPPFSVVAAPRPDDDEDDPACADDRPEVTPLPPLLPSLSDLDDRSRCCPPPEWVPPLPIRLDEASEPLDAPPPGGGGGAAEPLLLLPPPSRAASRPPVREAGSGRLEPAAGLRSSGR